MESVDQLFLISGEFKKTPVCHRSLNPTWCDSSGMGIEFQFSFSEDEQLCEDLLLLRVMDHDTYSGKVISNNIH